MYIVCSIGFRYSISFLLLFILIMTSLNRLILKDSPRLTMSTAYLGLPLARGPCYCIK